MKVYDMMRHVTHATLANIFQCYSPQTSCDLGVIATMFVRFQHGGHEVEVVM